MWLGAILSPWPELRVNELMLVFVPFDALMWWSPSPRYVFVRIVMLSLVAVLALAGVFVQPLWPFWVLAAASILARKKRAGASLWRGRKGILAT